MNDSRARFLDLMKREILKLDLADLDFGIYRILNYRRAEIEKFFDEELPELLDEAMSSEVGMRRAELEARLEGLRVDLERAATELGHDGAFLGDDPRSELTTSPKGMAFLETRAALERLAETPVFAQPEEDRLYNVLYTFFSRYYRDGDFQPQQRRGRQARYSVPYNGEDVHFHWRSKGSHYVKTTEELKSYSFRTGVWRVRFELIEAFQEPDNVKGSSRYFFPVPKECRTEVSSDGNLFVVPFAFRRLTTAEEKRYKKKSDEVEGDSIQERVIRDVGASIEPPSGITKKDLSYHLLRYARKNRTDYFVHPQLGAFLRDELQYYLKNEFLDIEGLTSTEAMADRLAKVRVLQLIANRIIGMLDEIESFQARLFEKRRFVLSNHYLVPIRLVPSELWAEVMANKAQIQQWREDFRISGKIGTSTLESHPTLIVDTSHYPKEFQQNLLASFDDISGSVDGVLVNSENFGALRTLSPSYAGSVKLVYIDPPYNTGGDGFLYKDEFSRHSAWLGLIEPRLRLGRRMLASDGALFVAIDDHEHANLKHVGDEVFGSANHLTSLIWEGGLKNDSRYISVGHDYMLGWLKDAEHVSRAGERWRTRKEGIDDIYAKVAELSDKNGTDYAATSAELKAWYEEIGKRHPGYAHRHYAWVDEAGVYFADNASWPGGGGPRYEVKHPVTGKPVVVPKRGWVFSTPERMAQAIADGRVHFGPDETYVPNVKRYLHETEGQVLASVFYRDRRAAMKQLREVMGGDYFSNPKDVLTLKKLIEASTTDESVVVDYFAGSGTTAHAVIELNRETGSLRTFVMVDMGEYFETVLKRRVAKAVYAPSWKDGAPTKQPEFKGDPPEWVGRSPRLVQVIKLESYEDALNSLGAAEDTLGAEHQIRYAIPDSVDESSTLLLTRNLESPFDYYLDVHTENGVTPVEVDLVTTFNLIKGIHPKRYRELDHEGRRYVIVEGTDRGELVLVVWRNVKGLDPLAERDFLETQIPAVLGVALDEYATIWHNADSALPNSESLDAEFKRLMFEPEPALS